MKNAILSYACSELDELNYNNTKLQNHCKQGCFNTF